MNNETPSKPSDVNEKDNFLIEYQKAQDSAEHHDNLVWHVTSIIWAGNLVLLGFVLENMTKSYLQSFLIYLSVSGILIVFCVFVFTLIFNFVKRQKYDRCKKLEKHWNFTQHRNLRYPSLLQLLLYFFVTIVFIFIWTQVLIAVCSCIEL